MRSALTLAGVSGLLRWILRACAVRAGISALPAPAGRTDAGRGCGKEARRGATAGTLWQRPPQAAFHRVVAQALLVAQPWHAAGLAAARYQATKLHLLSLLTSLSLPDRQAPTQDSLQPSCCTFLESFRMMWPMTSSSSNACDAVAMPVACAHTVPSSRQGSGS